MVVVAVFRASCVVVVVVVGMVAVIDIAPSVYFSLCCQTESVIQTLFIRFITYLAR